MSGFTEQDVLPMIYRFLIKAGYSKAAIKLQKECELDLSVPVGRSYLDHWTPQEETVFYR